MIQDFNRRPNKASLPDYPEQTRGSQLALAIRQEANQLTEEQRKELFRAGTQLIYGESRRLKN